ncbi:MAG: adenylosuccinate synthetase, partial [Treponemataceae bacterium]
LPRYCAIDKERDAKRKKPIGTTGRGIGTTYSMKSERDGIRIADLAWSEKLAEFEKEDIAFLDQYKEKLLSMKIDITAELWKNKDKNILFEGAQGVLLDLDLGTYPYVSSGLSCAAGAAVGSGLGPRDLDTILGVFKAYSTRVGNGPMPTEFNEQSQSELYHYVRETGREYGVTTGRPRRCGHLDLVALRYACRSNSMTNLVLTHLDVYDEIDSIEACVGYEIDGKIVEDFPTSIEDLNKATPVLKKFAGWKQSLKKCKTYDELPQNAKTYIQFIEEYTQTKIGIISVGYERKETFFIKNPWEN